MAKDVITRFKLETTGFDSKIKEAAKELSAYSKTATQAKEGFNQFTKANVDAARALGTMATSTTNAKDRAKELVGAFNEAAKAYNSLTKEQQQSDWAKALSGSLTQLQQRIKETKAEMQGLNNSMGDMGGGGIFSGLGSKMEGALAVFGGNLMTKAAGAVANLGAEMADMVKQGIEMAKAGEGVRIAFERLGNGQILDGLREATHGTVTDIELMKAAVKFNDFKLPIEELGTMLAFAQQKAKDTGQSVDYMVDSIVTGLGRKSLMILDNLGLSATEIRERMKETGDMTKAVGAIIRDQMKNAGDYVETAADRAAQANVSLQNKMEELGRKFAPIEEASNNLWTSMKIGILDIIGGPLATLLNQLTEAGRLRNQLNKMNGDPSTGQPTKVQQQLSTLRGSKYKNANYKGQLSQYDKQIGDLNFKIAAYGGKGKDAIEQGQVQQLKLQRDALKAMRSEYVQGAKDIMKPVEANVKTDKAEQNVKTLTAQLKELEKQRKKAVKKGDQEQVEALTKQISQTKTNLGYLDPNAVKTGKTGKTNIQYADDSIMAQEKLVSDLTQKWKTASGELRDGYLKDLEEAQKKLAEMTGKVKGPDLDKLFPDTSRENYNTGYAGSAQAKYDSARVDLALGPMNFDAINDYIGSIKGMLKDADLGSDLYNSMTERLKDATTVSTLLQEMMERGLEGADLESTAQALKEKLLSPEGIDQTAIQSFLDELNKQIEEAGGVGLKLNADTGEVTDDKGKGKDDGEDLKKFNEGIGKLTGGLSSVTSGLKAVGVDIPKEVDQVVGVINGVSQVISGIGTLISLFGAGAMTANTTAVSLNTVAIGGLIAALEFNTASNFIPFFANGGIVPHAANGYFVGGNSFSGDNTPIMANAGELVLSKSQQGVLASMLTDEERGGGNAQPYLDGEKIYLGLQAYMRRSGLGEIVTSER